MAGNTLLLPKLKQLPNNAVKLESIRQQLLAQHAGLNRKVQATMQVGADAKSEKGYKHQPVHGRYRLLWPQSSGQACRNIADLAADITALDQVTGSWSRTQTLETVDNGCALGTCSATLSTQQRQGSCA